MSGLPEHVRRNRTHWDQLALKYVAAGKHGWACAEPSWGIWSVPERDVRMFPDDLGDKDAIELGCGTAYVSSWLARRGTRVVGVDNSEQQLATARRLQREHGLNFPLIHGNAESVPYPDASFDFAISEYGACLWADPQRWVSEAARLLRPGGRLHFLTNAFLLTLCVPAEDDRAAGDQSKASIAADLESRDALLIEQTVDRGRMHEEIIRKLSHRHHWFIHRRPISLSGRMLLVRAHTSPNEVDLILCPPGRSPQL